MPLVAVALFALLGLIVVLLKILFGNIAWQAASMATLAMVSPIDLVWTTNPLIGAPLTEEIVFRGVLYRWLRGRLAVRSAILVTTTLFTLSHLLYGFPLPRLLPILVLGLALAVTVERTRSLYPAIALHFWYNLLAVALYLLPTLRG
jgi:hypothetical protein